MQRRENEKANIIQNGRLTWTHTQRKREETKFIPADELLASRTMARSTSAITGALVSTMSSSVLVSGILSWAVVREAVLRG